MGLDISGMNTQYLTQTLVESFNALADEVQNLSDRQTILEHKLRYAHEQFQYLADKYAAAAPEVSETLVNLQVPPELHNSSLANTNFVPLPNRKTSDSKHQIAVIIREGRRVASSLTDFSKSSQTSRSRDSLHPATVTEMSTILEQDFTVEGKRGSLDCPFSQPGEQDPQENGQQACRDAAGHIEDPICAAMFDETGPQQAAAKCPIRYLDQHSPEEVADYLEKHKHDLPRSHEVCLRRYQRSEEHVKKLDAKYSNLVSMVEGLGKIHQPMLPEQDTRPQSDVEQVSNDRVQDWAHTVSATVADDPDRTAPDHDDEDDERRSHFDRPLKEVRVGESPSRPWGISVPIFSDAQSSQGVPQGRPESPPAPVHMPSPVIDAETPLRTKGKCPFDHTKLTAMNNVTPHKQEDKDSVRLADIPPLNQPFTPSQHGPPPAQATASRSPQPAFLNPADLPRSNKNSSSPQMVFTGPVFIGYPVEQAIQFMQYYQTQQQ
ncbi:hypothetical protein F5Y08DRAFT_75416 [Xylaria arbuscula]|nr:hypothetical protein F5Y08DRAFT_75416 [Xylaria arbuscula]